MVEFTPKLIIYALLGGIVPAVIWLWFWLKEDDARPEPKGIIGRAFLAGGLAVFITYFCDRFFVTWVLHHPGIIEEIKQLDVPLNWTRETWVYFRDFFFIFLGLSAIEEVLKFAAARVAALRNRAYDEPIDAMIYLVTAAVGFAAIENSLFLFNALSSSADQTFFLLTGNLRFLGATMLHIVCSAALGAFVGSAFYASRVKQWFYVSFGLCTASLLHALFNSFIITDGGKNIFAVFAVLWLAAVAIIFYFEKLRQKQYV